MARRRITEVRVQLIGSNGEQTGEIILPVGSNKRMRSLDHNNWTPDEAMRRFGWYLARGDRPGLEAAYLALEKHGGLSEALTNALRGRRPNLQRTQALLHLWNSRGLWSLPRALAHDLPIFAEAVGWAAPPVTGLSRTLYRGQSKARFEAEDVGIAWTGTLAVAERFAPLRNTPGIVLEVEASPAEIAAYLPDLIQTPKSDRNAGTEFEDEYLLDPRPLMPKIRVR